MKDRVVGTCEECVYSSPARPPYTKDYIRCNEKHSDFGRSHNIVYVVKHALCNIFKRIKDESK